MLKWRTTCNLLLALRMSHRRPKRRKETECQPKRVETGKSSTSNKFKKWTESWREELINSVANREERSNLHPENLSRFFFALVLPASSMLLLRPLIAVKILLRMRGQQPRLSLLVKVCGRLKLSQRLILKTTRSCSHQVSKQCSRKPFQQWTTGRRYSIRQTCQSL